ncbi:MAG: SPOR domain-containing protein [Prevotellaceae bacterium]|jgi:cell division protein FtsN|nr:SPOR domain-containing protein [Prevotellaceae bacterium]
MKRLFCICLAAAAALAMTGCDWFKTTFLGQPSNVEQALLAQAVQVWQDSLAQVAATGALASVDSIQQPVAADSAALRYHVIVGSFKARESADRMLKLLQDEGYTAQMVVFKSGFFGVSVSSHSEVHAAMRALHKILPLAFCPEDAWVYDAHTLWHKAEQ